MVMMSSITTETSKFRERANIHPLAEDFKLAVSANCDSFPHHSSYVSVLEEILKEKCAENCKYFRPIFCYVSL